MTVQKHTWPAARMTCCKLPIRVARIFTWLRFWPKVRRKQTTCTTSSMALKGRHHAYLTVNLHMPCRERDCIPRMSVQVHAGTHVTAVGIQPDVGLCLEHTSSSREQYAADVKLEASQLNRLIAEHNQQSLESGRNIARSRPELIRVGVSHYDTAPPGLSAVSLNDRSEKI